MRGMTGRFKAILADPPWHHRNRLEFRRALHPSSAYETMTVDDICKIPVADWAADPCVLALWTTPPMVDVGIDVLRAWGFQYVTSIPWLKQWPNGKPRRGAGTWFMQMWEQVLFGEIGSPGVIKHGDRGVLGLLLEEPKGLFAVPPKRHHSAKPYDLHDYLAAFPGPRLEIFATEEREGWTTWGYDTGFRLSQKGVERGDGPVEPQGMLSFEGQAKRGGFK